MMMTAGFVDRRVVCQCDYNWADITDRMLVLKTRPHVAEVQLHCRPMAA